MILKYQDTLFELKAKNLVASVTLPIRNKRLDGQSSSTLTSNQGSKAKSLSFACLIPFSEKEHLSELIAIAEAIEDDGARRVYRIQQEDAAAADVREVIFDGNLSFRKTENLLAWSVNFSLLQVHSVPESKERRIHQKTTDKPTQQDSTQGQAVNTDNDKAADTDTLDLIKERNLFEKVLKKIDTFLAPDKL